MSITMTLNEFISRHASDFVKVELAISSAVFEIVGGSSRPIVQLDSEPMDSMDPSSGEIGLKFNGRMVLSEGLTGKQLGDILSTAMTSLDLGFSWSEADGVMKFTVVMPLLSFDTSLLNQEVPAEETEPPGPVDTGPGPDTVELAEPEVPESEPPPEPEVQPDEEA